MMQLSVKLFCKAVEGASRAATWLKAPFARDATQILLANFTAAQKKAEKNLAASGSAAAAAPGRVKLLVLVPFRDHWSITKECLDSIEKQAAPAIEARIVLIDNGSKDPGTVAAMADRARGQLANGFSVKILKIDEPFNFSRLNNLGVAFAADFAPDFVLFLNNDVEFLTPDTLSRLLAFARATPRLGALGCTLLFPDRRVQHLFLAPGVKIVGAHPFKGFRLPASAAWFQAPRPVAAVTGAALLLSAASFQKVHGFDEALPTVGQDLDLCLKLQKAGLTNWVLPDVQMLHKEGASRGKAIAKHEVAAMYAKWGEFLTKNPFYSSRLSRYSETPAYRLLEPPYPWEKVLP